METDSLIDSIVKFYQDRSYQRGPYKSGAALNKAKTADEASTQRIIIDESEPAWHVYHAASKAVESTHGFVGKAELGRLLAALRTQSAQQQRSFAQQLAKKLSSCTPQPMDVSENEGSERVHKRRCMCALLLVYYMPNIA
jgi:hypothetical protein